MKRKASGSGVPEGFKMTELGPLPEEWDIATLEDVATISMGQSPPGSSYNETGRGMPFLQGKAEFGSTCPTHLKYTTMPLRKAQPGSVLISVRAPVGAVNLADRTYCFGRGLAALSMRNGDNMFLLHVLRHRRAAIEQLGSGSTFKAINKSILQKVIVPCPPLHEQEQIAAILSTVQQAKEKTEAVIAAAKEMKKSLMKYLFTYGPVPVEEAERVKLKETEIGMMPEEWYVFALGETAEVKGGKRLPKGHAFADGTTQHPYLRVVDMKNGTIDRSDLRYLCESDYQTLSHYTIASDDVYITIAGTIGVCGTVPMDLDGANLTENAAKIVLGSARLDKDFLAYYLSSSEAQTQISLRTCKTSQPKLALTRIRQLPVAAPTLHLQKEIASALRVLDAKVESEQGRMEALDRLFGTLLNGLMTGRIRVNDLEVEP